MLKEFCDNNKYQTEKYQEVQSKLLMTDRVWGEDTVAIGTWSLAFCGDGET